MSLRARLVLALVGLFAVGMTVYGVASYQAFARAELARLDDQVRGTVPAVARELGVGGSGPLGGHHGRGGPDGPPRVVVAPGTYAELRGPDGALLDTVQVADGRPVPDLGAVVPGGDQPVTVATDDAATSWRVLGRELPEGRTVLVAVPTTAVDEALDRLLAIQLTAGAALLLVLGGGAWLVLRSGLRPLERIAASTRAITAGSLDQRVPTPEADTEVRQVATALNAMLDDLEGAFHEREATEAKLRRFLSDASHELRTPLTSIQGYAELFRLAGDRDDVVDLELVARRIESESDRMRVLVEDLLVLARLDEGRTTAREPVDLAVLAIDACSDATAVEPARPITLDAPTSGAVTGDPQLLRQAVGNLVTNALRHTPAGTPVEVAVHRADHEVTLQVRDHGPGLRSDALTHAFDRFWQADPARSGQGSGLGLSIVQAIAAEHGGTITATNAEDGGAVFTLTLPSEAATHAGSTSDDRRAPRVL